MKVRSVTLLFSLLLIAGVALAHGDKKHVAGTVEKVGADSVTVKQADGNSVEVKLVAGTTYVARVGTVDKPGKLADLHVGDRVVIHATPKPDNTLEAAEVRFSSPTAAAAPASKPN